MIIEPTALPYNTYLLGRGGEGKPWVSPNQVCIFGQTWFSSSQRELRKNWQGGSPAYLGLHRAIRTFRRCVF